MAAGYWRYGLGGSLLDDMGELQSQLNQAMDNWGFGAGGYRFPPANLWVNGDGATLDAELPGVEMKDIEIALVGDTLTISGRRDPAQLKEDETCHRRERHFGAFSRSLQLPFPADAAKVTATLRNGILRVVLPRAESDKPKKIAIQGG